MLTGFEFLIVAGVFLIGALNIGLLVYLEKRITNKREKAEIIDLSRIPKQPTGKGRVIARTDEQEAELIERLDERAMIEGKEIVH